MICKRNAGAALDVPETIEYFKTNGIVPLQADFTRQPKWMLEEIKSFGRTGVPLVLYYPSHGGDPVILPNQLWGSSHVIGIIQEAEANR